MTGRPAAPRWDAALSELSALGGAVRPHAVPAVAISLLIALLYLGTLRWLVNAWRFDEYYGHGFLVVPIALFFMWRARHRVAAAPATARPAHVVALAPGILLYALAFRAGDAFLFAVSLVAVLVGALVYVLGPAKARPLALPTAFLMFAVPLPNLIYVGAHLQELATWGTTSLLALVGMDFAHEGFTITAGGLVFEVAPICSGLSSAISILMLTTVVAALAPLRMASRLALVAASVPVALAANVLRIGITIGIGVRWGPDASHGFFHGASNLVLFLIAFGCVLALSVLLQRAERRWAVG